VRAKWLTAGGAHNRTQISPQSRGVECGTLQAATQECTSLYKSVLTQRCGALIVSTLSGQVGRRKRALDRRCLAGHLLQGEGIVFYPGSPLEGCTLY
jgi:hypothetical protein